MRWSFRCTSSIIAIALMLVAALPCVAQAASTVRVVPVDLNVNPEKLFASATFLDDPKGSYNINDVSHGRASAAFQPFPHERSRDRVIKGWFRFAIRLAPKDVGKISIQSRLPTDVFDLYYPRTNGTYGVVHAGMLVPFADRNQSAPWPVVPITAEMASGRPLYIYLVHNRFVFGNELFDVDATRAIAAGYQDQRVTENFFGGLLFAVIVTNLFLGFYLRDRTFFAYVVAMAFHVLTQFTQSGTSWVLFWPHASVPFIAPAWIFEGLFFVSLAVFWRTFLKPYSGVPTSAAFRSIPLTALL